MVQIILEVLHFSFLFSFFLFSFFYLYFLLFLQSVNLPRKRYSRYSGAKPIRHHFRTVFRIRVATATFQLKIPSALNRPIPFQMALHLAVT